MHHDGRDVLVTRVAAAFCCHPEDSEECSEMPKYVQRVTVDKARRFFFGSVASLRLVSPGVATDGVTNFLKSDDLF